MFFFSFAMLVGLCLVAVFFFKLRINFYDFIFSALSNGLPALRDLTLSANQGNRVVTLKVGEPVANRIYILWGKTKKKLYFDSFNSMFIYIITIDVYFF